MIEKNNQKTLCIMKSASLSTIYEYLIQPILRNDSGIDAEYLTNLSLKLIAFSSRQREWSLISKLFKNINDEFCIKDPKLTQNI